MSRLTVQHWIACLEARVVPPVGVNNFYELLGVGYVHTFAGDVEFPAVVPELNMFARFVNGKGVAQLEIEVFWLDAPEGERLVNYYPPYQITFRQNEPLRDFVFRLANVPVCGTGRHSICLYRSKRRDRVVLSSEYFSVVQLP
ncbi:MAG: hypothetical protein J0I06_25245 [Planctomycetes bacterium]|nr:hypothetical protein [Planctomycetota bacterium]